MARPESATERRSGLTRFGASAPEVLFNCRWKEVVMTAHSKNTLLRSMLLMLLGLIALFLGTKSLVLLIPAAALLWYEARPPLHGGRN
jgi:hypothetical protein